jgi:actin-related protein
MDTSTNGLNEGSVGETKEKSQKKFLFDTMSIKAARPHMQVQSFLKDGLVEDWDLFEKVLNYTFGKHLRCDPSKHPILMSEPVVGILFLYSEYI